MLKDRIISTLRFFDLQGQPLSLLEICRFLAAGRQSVIPALNREWDIIDGKNGIAGEPAVSAGQIAGCLSAECASEVESYKGFYCLPGRRELIEARIKNYAYGLQREKLIRRYVPFLRHLPFVRGAALGGSQAFGPQKPTSDIDLLIITDERFMGLARFLVTLFFHLAGRRRHGKLVANRFCLNHYLGRPKLITRLKNMYSAMEYSRLRPLVYPQSVNEFRRVNSSWIGFFFPNAANSISDGAEKQSAVQSFLEKLLLNRAGFWLESSLKAMQLKKIKMEKFIVVEPDELSFHPDSKQEELLEKYFSYPARPV